MEEDRDAVCGPKRHHYVERGPWRGGSVADHVTLGGRQVSVFRLRVRNVDGDVFAGEPPVGWGHGPTGSAHAGSNHRGRCRHVGLRRRWTRCPGTSRSRRPRAVRCRGGSWRSSAARLRAFLNRPLIELDPRVVFIGGKVVRDHGIVIVFGSIPGARARARAPWRRHGNGRSRHRAAQRPGDAGAAGGPDDAVRGGWRLRRCAEPSRTSTGQWR